MMMMIGTRTPDKLHSQPASQTENFQLGLGNILNYMLILSFHLNAAAAAAANNKSVKTKMNSFKAKIETIITLSIITVQFTMINIYD